jgi:hypothetical protein
MFALRMAERSTRVRALQEEEEVEVKMEKVEDKKKETKSDVDLRV